jgi:hypothetical protein
MHDHSGEKKEGAGGHRCMHPHPENFTGGEYDKVPAALAPRGVYILIFMRKRFDYSTSIFSQACRSAMSGCPRTKADSQICSPPSLSQQKGEAIAAEQRTSIPLLRHHKKYEKSSFRFLFCTNLSERVAIKQDPFTCLIIEKARYSEISGSHHSTTSLSLEVAKNNGQDQVAEG